MAQSVYYVYCERTKTNDQLCAKWQAQLGISSSHLILTLDLAFLNQAAAEFSVYRWPQLAICYICNILYYLNKKSKTKKATTFWTLFMFLIFAPALEEEDGLHLKALLVAIAHAIQLKAPSCSVPSCIFTGLPELFISTCFCQYAQPLQVDLILSKEFPRILNHSGCAKPK